MSILNIVATECKPESDSKFNKWYNEVHIPLIMKFKDIYQASRYKNLDPQSAVPTYLAFYFYNTIDDMNNSFISPEFGAALKDMQETWKDGENEAKWVSAYERIIGWNEDKSDSELHAINIVATECKPELEDKFNKWYNETHIPFFLNYKGLKKVIRFKKIDQKSDLPKYIAVYYYGSKEEMEGMPKSPEFSAAGKEMQETWKDGGFDVKWAAPYNHIMTIEK